MLCIECFEKLLDKCKNANKVRKEEEQKHFDKVRTGLTESMISIGRVTEDVKDWDELMNIKEVSLDSNKLRKSKSIKPELKSKRGWFDLFGFFFCLSHLIGIQAAIIILNSLFSEIVDEFQLWLSNTPREYNFYQKLEINTYRELPEIDVGMVTSSIGIVILKNIGFKKTNSIFQLISSILFALLFILFNFHIGDQLLENYNRIEMLVLVLSYIILSFLVGCSSTIALKQYFDLNYDIYYKQEKLDENVEKISFYTYSGLSAFIIIFINRFIFTSFKDITNKWLLVAIIGVCFASFFSSLIFYLIYSIPIINKIKKNKAVNQIPEDNKSGTSKEEKSESQKEDIDEVVLSSGEDKNISEENMEKRINKIQSNSNQKNRRNNFVNINTQKDSEILRIKSNNISAKNNSKEIEIKKEDNLQKNIKEKKEIYSTKICTVCGYIYVKRQNKNQKACIFYYYTDKTTWLKEKIIKFDTMTSIIIEFYCQFSIIGFNSILYNKLYYEYSYKKYLKFFTALFFISLFFGSMFAPAVNTNIKMLEEEEEKEKKDDLETKENKDNKDDISDQEYKNKNNKQNKPFICNNKYCNHLVFLICLLLGFVFLTFISSICYLCDDNKTRTRWDNIIMAEFIFFKSLDMFILSFFDFFDNSEIFNATLFITLEKFIWMIIEAIFEACGVKEKTLIIIQLAFSSIPIAGLLYFIGLFLCLCIYKC